MILRIGGGIAILAVAGSAAAASLLQPPAFFLRSKAGIQHGAQGSYSLRTDTFSQFVDAMPPHPDTLAVVRPGERLVLRANAALRAPAASLGAVGCGTGRWKSFHPRAGVWRIAAPKRPGAYEIGLSTSFRTQTTRGDSSVAFGILVSRTMARQMVPASRYAVC